MIGIKYQSRSKEVVLDKTEKTPPPHVNTKRILLFQEWRDMNPDERTLDYRLCRKILC